MLAYFIEMDEITPDNDPAHHFSLCSYGMELGSGNFAFLKPHDIQLVRLGALAERYFHDDPNTCLIKLRQFGELLAQLIAGKTGLLQSGEESQADLGNAHHDTGEFAVNAVRCASSFASSTSSL
jgi:hypothetical protein